MTQRFYRGDTRQGTPGPGKPGFGPVGHAAVGLGKAGHGMAPNDVLTRAFPGEPHEWPVLVDSTWEPRVIPNPIPEMNVGVWDALVDVVLDVCCWLFRKATRTH